MVPVRKRKPKTLLEEDLYVDVSIYFFKLVSNLTCRLWRKSLKGISSQIFLNFELKMNISQPWKMETSTGCKKFVASTTPRFRIQVLLCQMH